MSVQLIRRNFIIDKELIDFRIKKYDCRIVYGYRYYNISSEEPFRIEVLIEMPDGEGSFSFYDKPFETFIYKNDLYIVDKKNNYTEDQMKLMIKHHYYKENEKFIKMQKEVEAFESENKEK